MSHKLKVSLGGTEYDVPKLNIGQLRQVTKIFSGPVEDVSFDILKVALARAEPKVTDVDQLEADVGEIGKAVSDILVHAGLKEADPKNPHRRRESTG
jgi:hypothetical protein